MTVLEMETLIRLIQTTEDLKIFKTELQHLRSSLFNERESFDTVLNTKVRKNIAQEIAKLLSEQKIDTKSLLDSIELELKKLKFVHLTLSFEPNAQSFAAIYQWFLDNVGADIVLDIYHNPNILGGVQLSSGGKYFDGSLISKVEEILKQRQNDNDFYEKV